VKLGLVFVVAAVVLGTASPAAAQRFRSVDEVLQIYAPREDDVPVVDLYTFEVGPLIFEKFGHSALCLSYRSPEREPLCFNYGVTNFRDGAKLIWGFLRTQQKFWVEPEPLRLMKRFYGEPQSPSCPRCYGEDRTIWKQTLPLTREQARALEAKLLSDIKEENRYYYYDHFFDNCATRLRDMVDWSMGGVVKQKASGYYPLTFRELGARGLTEIGRPLGFTDYFVGRTLDRYPTMWEAMFLPEVLRAELAARHGVEPVLIYQRKGPPFPTSGPFGRDLTTLVALLFALPLLIARWRRRFERVALGWALVPLVFFGIMTWAVAIISTIPGLRWNEALFLFTPTDLAIPWLGERRRRIYTRVRLAIVVLVSLLAAVGIFKQPLWVPILTAFMPLAILAFDLPHGLRDLKDKLPGVAKKKATASTAA
jgi:hypothetical protein